MIEVTHLRLAVTQKIWRSHSNCRCAFVMYQENTKLEICQAYSGIFNMFYLVYNLCSIILHVFQSWQRLLIVFSILVLTDWIFYAPGLLVTFYQQNDARFERDQLRRRLFSTKVDFFLIKSKYDEQTTELEKLRRTIELSQLDNEALIKIDGF